MSLVKEHVEKIAGVRKLCLSLVTCTLISGLHFLPFLAMPAPAADSQPQKGALDDYGEKQKITTSAEARKALKKYFADKDLIIGEVIEKELYFEADIMDSNKAVIDKVIVDKRTGRIRSIY
jgi:hypothetical protein